MNTSELTLPSSWIDAGSSSWLHSFRYDEGDLHADLYVRFKDRQGRITATCLYRGVPAVLYQGLLAASSKGSYFHRSSLYQWPYTEL